MTVSKFIRVSASELRRRFNEGGYWAGVQAGDLTVVVTENNHPSAPLADEPICTKSQIVEIRTKDGKKVAKAHRYLRADGTLGASGNLDPKSVLVGDILYILVGR